MAESRRMNKSELYAHFAERLGIKRAEAGAFFDELQQLTRNDSIRTLVRTPIEADFIEVFEPPRYQAIAPQAAKLRRLGYPDNLIAACTGVTDKTVAKAIRWFENRSSALD